MSARRRDQKAPAISVHTDEEAVQRWRKRSGEGEPGETRGRGLLPPPAAAHGRSHRDARPLSRSLAGAHCVQVSLQPELVGSCNWPADRFPSQLQTKLHEECASQTAVLPPPAARARRAARADSWPKSKRRAAPVTAAPHRVAPQVCHQLPTGENWRQPHRGQPGACKALVANPREGHPDHSDVQVARQPRGHAVHDPSCHRALPLTHSVWSACVRSRACRMATPLPAAARL